MIINPAHLIDEMRMSKQLLLLNFCWTNCLAARQEDWGKKWQIKYAMEVQSICEWQTNEI